MIEKNKSARMSITMNNTTKCSGNCSYCMAASFNSYGLNPYHDIEVLKHIDNEMYKQWKFDPKQIEITLITDQRMYQAEEWNFDIWGADPVTNFKCLKDLVGLLRKLAKKYHKKLIMSTSTNGLPLMRDDITKWFLKQKDISIQLSHDGVGQKYRTKDFDPLDIPNVRKLMQKGVLNAINATLNQKNNSLWANINYFNKKFADIFPGLYGKDENGYRKVFERMQVKLNHIMDSEYDFAFHGRELDDYIQEWFQLLTKDQVAHDCNWLEYKPYMNYIRGQFSRGTNITDSNCNLCRKFQMGLIERGDHIDSTGRYCQCNLVDADHQVENPTNELPEYCKDCKFNKSGECNMCGAMKHRSKCEYLYRWNQFLQIARYVVGVNKNGNKSQRSKACSDK